MFSTIFQPSLLPPLIHIMFAIVISLQLQLYLITITVERWQVRSMPPLQSKKPSNTQYFVHKRIKKGQICFLITTLILN